LEIDGAAAVGPGLLPGLSLIEADSEAGRSGRLDVLNEAIMHGVNATGEALLSHTKLNDKLTLRLSVGNIRTTEKQVRRLGITE